MNSLHITTKKMYKEANLPLPASNISLQDILCLVSCLLPSCSSKTGPTASPPPPHPPLASCFYSFSGLERLLSCDREVKCMDVILVGSGLTPVPWIDIFP